MNKNKDTQQNQQQNVQRLNTEGCQPANHIEISKDFSQSQLLQNNSSKFSNGSSQFTNLNVNRINNNIKNQYQQQSFKKSISQQSIVSQNNVQQNNQVQQQKKSQFKDFDKNESKNSKQIVGQNDEKDKNKEINSNNNNADMDSIKSEKKMINTLDGEIEIEMEKQKINDLDQVNSYHNLQEISNRNSKSEENNQQQNLKENDVNNQSQENQENNKSQDQQVKNDSTSNVETVSDTISDYFSQEEELEQKIGSLQPINPLTRKSFSCQNNQYRKNSFSNNKIHNSNDRFLKNQLSRNLESENSLDMEKSISNDKSSKYMKLFINRMNSSNQEDDNLDQLLDITLKNLDLGTMRLFTNKMLKTLFEINSFQVAQLTKETQVIEQELDKYFEFNMLYILDSYKKKHLPSGLAIGDSKDSKLLFFKTTHNNQIYLMTFVVPVTSLEGSLYQIILALSTDVLQINQPNKNEIRIDLNFSCKGFHLLTNIPKNDVDIFLSCKHFERHMTEYYGRLLKKTQSWLIKIQMYKYYQKSAHQILMEFNKDGHLYYTSSEVPQEIIKKYQLVIPKGIEKKDDLNFRSIFKENKIMLRQLLLLTKESSIDQTSNLGQDIILQRFFTMNDSFKGITIYFQYQQILQEKEVNLQAPLRKQSKALAKLKRAVRKIYATSILKNSTYTKQNMIEELTTKQSNLIEFLSDTEQIRLDNQRQLSMKLTPFDRQNSDDGESGGRSPQQKKNKGKMEGFVVGKEEIKKIVAQQVRIPQHDLFQPVEFKYDQFEFDAFNLSPVEQYRFVVNYFQKYKFIERFNIPFGEMRQFLDQLKYQYNKRNNPFHNFFHALTVMQGCHYLATTTVLKNYLSDLQIFCVVFSGLCHDVNHTARTNIYEVNSMSKLAIRYNDKSVLEQHHIAQTFKILKNQNSNILKNVQPKELIQIRQQMVNNILMTDNQSHFTNLKQFEKLTPLKEVDELNKTDSDLITGMVVHAADFYGNAQKFQISKIWSYRVSFEFQRQYMQEAEMNLPQTPYYKDLHKLSVLAKGEAGFSKFIVTPLWKSLNEYLQLQLQEPIKNLEQNLKQWEIYSDEQTNNLNEEQKIQRKLQMDKEQQFFYDFCEKINNQKLIPADSNFFLSGQELSQKLIQQTQEFIQTLQ
ncbi:hypothetical protein PPERSA_10704 [Pseudocohnilembus persalinus]|uniref:Phosphodiesterase n=1 Tax=Pseudocohnilembus persalinus TaxID=266149 RepID=A0A0V0QDC5_PSEPJ|nr:hypothetical protein PPERSA_10704 [Pseudocohnilembus persalinus]|eukprot:KRX00205.1 hypothetical protein PPERSA_10704 [Pseudocohnilembus persalinus]